MVENIVPSSTVQPATPTADADDDDDTFDPTEAPEGLDADSSSELVLDYTPHNVQIALPVGASKPDAIYYLSQQIPTNEYGLPIFFYRSDLIPYSGPQDQSPITQEDLDLAAVPLTYQDGYPALANSTPFWSQLPNEPYEAFLVFERYLQQAEETGIRQLNLLANAEVQNLPHIVSLYREFYWSARARAYDMFIVAAESKRREHRIRRTENTHFVKAQTLLDQLLKRFENDDWMEDLEPKDAISILETLVKIQRLSLGLTGAHSSSATFAPPAPAGSSSELILRQMTKTLGLSDQGQQNFATALQGVLTDPEYAMQAQELIIRVNQGSQ